MNDTRKDYDVIIVGGGPGGLSAGIYTARSRLSTLLVEKGMIGGYIINTEKIENYPGYEGIGGFELTMAMHKQAESFGLETVYSEVITLEQAGDVKIIKTGKGEYKAKAVIIAAGSERQKIGCPGEDKFTGRGLSVCATCDGAFFTDKPVAVVGGGNAALTEAMELVKFASRITIIHRRDELRAAKILEERAKAEPKIEFLWDSVVEAVEGDAFVEKLKIKNVKTGKGSDLEVSGVFVAIGFRPNTAYLKGLVELDAAGAIKVNDRMETSVPGIFAVGDIRSNSIRQVVAAAGDGAVAAVNAEKYISGQAISL
jgi:thioredoxin reductase (NADPH)